MSSSSSSSSSSHRNARARTHSAPTQLTSKTNKTQQTFPLAFPPPVKSPQCLRRLTPNLRLQIQQLSSKHRHIPVLEVWQPSIFNSRVSKNIPKLGSRDVYVSQCEGFLHLGKDGDNSAATATTKNQKKD
ncbi:hypothetical protein LTS12_028057, partial [Elasticomyces elasticus]